jgi:membrane-bound lytic murein transglycosylase D
MAAATNHWEWERATREHTDRMLAEARQLAAAGDRQQALSCLDHAIAGLLSPPPGYESREAYLDFLAALIAEARQLEETGLCTVAAPARRRHGDSMSRPASRPEPLIPASDFPLVLNSRVGRFLEAATRPGDFRRRLQRGLERAGSYLPMIRAKLAAAGLPEDLAYLPIIESSFSRTAHSRAGAHGMWQFMPATARQYGLRVSSRIDERRDPVRSTDAAVRYLGHLHARFDDWLLALAAYNSGAGRVGRALARAHRADFWHIRRQLPRETRDYVPSFIAAVIVAKRPHHYGLPAIVERGQVFEPTPRRARRVVQRSLSRGGWYVVQPRDTLWGIARSFAIELDDLCAHNALPRDAVIHPGDMLKIPTGRARG